MSRTYCLVCRACELGIWIGQGENFATFYTGEPRTMDILQTFLRAHMNKPIVMMDTEHACADLDNYRDLTDEEHAHVPIVCQLNGKPT